MEIIEKVKAVIATDLTSYEIEKRTGVSRPTIDNMRKKGDDFDYNKMTLQTAESLANYYDSMREASRIFLDQGGYITFTTYFDRFLSEAKQMELASLSKEENKAMQTAIDKLKNVALNDLDLLQDIYESYKENLYNK